jgi:hypothetical protein
MTSFPARLTVTTLAACTLAASPLLAETKPAALPPVSDAAGVKKYLVDTVGSMEAAAQDFVKNAEAYTKLVAGGDYQAAYAGHGVEIKALVEKMRENYKAMDSYGYETVEGIVAGVEKLAQFDVDMDAGVPASEGPDDVAQITLKLPNGETVDRQGALFTYVIEPALWGGDKRWITPVDLDGDGAVKFRESLPKAEVLTAAATEAEKRISALLAEAKAWEPTKADFFGAMTLMTPTLSEYFEDWKESRYSAEPSGRFFAVSRVSDMRGIMQSCAVMFQAVDKDVAAKDKALAASVTTGFEEIFAFLDKIAARETKGDLSLAEIDELANQAKDRTDKLVPQIEQAQALTSGS